MTKKQAYEVFDELKSKATPLLEIPAIQAYNILKAKVPNDDLYSSDDGHRLTMWSTKATNDRWWIGIGASTLELDEAGKFYNKVVPLKEAYRYEVQLYCGDRKMDSLNGLYEAPTIGKNENKLNQMLEDDMFE